MTLNKKELYFLLACFIWIIPFFLPNRYGVLLRCALLALIIWTQYVKRNALLILSMLYVGLVGVSTLLFDYGAENLLKTFSVMSVFLGCIVCASNPANIKAIPNGILKGLTLYVVIDAYFIFVQNGIAINDNGQPLYFSGGKFDVCYMYLLWMMLLFLRYKRMKVYQQLILGAFGMFLSLYVDCSTGLIGIFAFLAVMLLPKYLKEGKLKYIWLAGTLCIHYLVVFVQIQSNNPMLQYIITKVLNKQVHLTGRVNIYNNFSEIMENHWLLGYGYTSDRIVEVTNLANTQNGFLQAIYTGGIVSLIIFMILLVYVVYCISKVVNVREQNILFSALIAFLVIAIVEIPFTSVIFYLLLSIIYVYSCKGKGEYNV